ncbi:hypothetical protein [Hymenobacter chitinivorans]|uniref:Uncharacterized protein n=1 Tax=Hymenobacter chitinivorans DSM 11115 TaxID=1121954 RepID=A0A2M9BTC1_9BACT|nr:hypothetical protein [Hymenobacter chitinivorans]PJJ61210.1 hypothetical protein CLV45_2648 [Hymenobacter chitinivorans DSM 11115]
MQPTTSRSFALVRTFVFRRYLTLRNHTAPLSDRAAEAARKARKRLKKQAKHERLRNFFGWCEGCAAYASIF